MFGGCSILSSNFIGTNRYDEQLYVQCDCGDEIIEFVKNNSEEDGVEYVIIPHLHSENKSDPYPSFCFTNKGEFSEFLEVLKNARDNVDSPELGVFFDKYLTHKNKYPGVLVTAYLKKDEMVAMSKYPTPKTAEQIRDVSWEMFINRNKAIKILDILENWG